MYFPYSRRRNPTNRECRVAAILSVFGFTAFGWMCLTPPDGFLAFLAELSLVLLLNWLGLATLLHAKPYQGLLWPQLRARLDSGDSRPPLDERDYLIRYRTFQTSYQILSVLIWAIVILPGLLGSNLNTLTARYHGPLELALLTMSLLMVLTWLLPHWVIPWLESDVILDTEPEEPLSLRGAPEQRTADARSRWVRRLWKVSPWALWTFIFLLLLEISSVHFPGGLRAIFHF
jgi:hypothetical protein